MKGKWVEFVWRGNEHRMGKVTAEQPDLYYQVWSVQETICGSHLTLIHEDQITSVLCDEQSLLLEIQYGDYVSSVPVRS